MDPSTTTRTRTRARSRVLAAAGAGVLLFAALPAGIASAHGGGDGRTLHVGPGHYTSIQDAVEDANSGDTIRIAAGTYNEAVCIQDKGLTIRGAGRDRTIIKWDIGVVPTDPRGIPCWQATDDADQEDDDPQDTLDDNVSGLFFLNPDSPVVVKDLQTRNHTANGIAAWGADGLTVTNTKGVGHDRYGILGANSRNIHVVGNVEEGIDRSTNPLAPDAGTAGISVGDSADSGTFIAGNRVRGYNLGIFLRESSGGRVDANHLSGNCIGILAFDDSFTEIPGSPPNVEAGDWKISANVSAANNRYCLQGPNGDQRISGVGMAVVNMTDVRFTANVIRDNKAAPPQGAGPLTFPSGGLVMLTFEPFTPGGVDPGPVDRVDVVANWFGDNHGFEFRGAPPPVRVQLDILLSQAVPNTPVGTPGEDIEFRANRCDASIPYDICGQPYPV
ncbi:parallel beta-helix repeat protein [Geodermatophilus normandii]|uniref:Parallel beta-helix repeat protein n=1 Tax=Geodermatophilus normandii TaxID=1137989 RepID=A0A317QG17_9ACTN|nr:right-handed parallel beta-helix repeat-containing protein [Geodermatophilus normandii]PWW22019.1 parallel beta-helix repeat protein [Geodermatophilus normandii]